MAIKKIAMKLGKYTEGANFTALREIKLLQELKHEHIIEVSGSSRAAVWFSCQRCYPAALIISAFRCALSAHPISQHTTIAGQQRPWVLTPLHRLQRTSLLL